MNSPTWARWERLQVQYDLPHLRLRQVAAIVNQIAPARMADLGCSTGILRELCVGIEYVGCDMVEPAETGKFQFLLCDFNENEIPREIADMPLIVCSGILEYIIDLPSFLEQVRSRLAEDGYLVATYFNMNHISRLATLMLGRTLPMHTDWRGCHSPRTIRKILADVGFVQREIYATSHSLKPSPAAALTILHRAVLSKAMPWSSWLAHQLIYVCAKHR